MSADWPYVINLGNSIIGVSVLAMPFCFKECGILLGMLLLLSCAWLTHITCKLLMKSAIASKKRSYEFLALYTFGSAGKFGVEISIIGLLIGTCVAFHVIIGDLGPAIVSKITGLENTSTLRTFLMLFLGMFVALPLGLLRNIESLSNVSAVSFCFYGVFISQILIAAFPNLWSGLWMSKVNMWIPAGVFKCLPIFSLAFSCQSQLFVMYEALPEPSLTRMSSIAKNAISMCTTAYLLVGYLGYVAFCDDSISGDVLMNFRPSLFSEAVKLGFVLSVALSFPLVIFPCRASLYTLLFTKASEHDNYCVAASLPIEANIKSSPRATYYAIITTLLNQGESTIAGGGTVIPDLHFKGITIVIVFSTLLLGITVPNVEFILALTGATMGSMICYIFPAVMFISVMSLSKSGTKSTAQVVLFLGVTILLASTYVTLYAQDRKASESVVIVAPDDNKGKEDPPVAKPDVKAPATEGIKEGKRQEPPVPRAPPDPDKVKEVKGEETVKTAEKPPVEKKSKTEAPAVAPDKKASDKVENKIMQVLEENRAVQSKLMQQQKELLDELRQHKHDAAKQEGQPRQPGAVQPQTAVPQQKQDALKQVHQPQNAAAASNIQQKPAQLQPNAVADVKQPVVAQQQAAKHQKQHRLDKRSAEQQDSAPNQIKQPVAQQPADDKQQIQPKQAVPQSHIVQQQMPKQQPIQQQVKQPPAAQQQPIQQQPIQQQPVQQQPVPQQPVQQQVQQQPVQQRVQQQPPAVQQQVQQQHVPQQPIQQQPVQQQVQQQPAAVRQQVQQQPVQQQNQQPLAIQQQVQHPPVQQQVQQHPPAVQQQVQQHPPAVQQQVQQQPAAQQLIFQKPPVQQLANQPGIKQAIDGKMDRVNPNGLIKNEDIQELVKAAQKVGLLPASQNGVKDVKIEQGAPQFEPQKVAADLTNHVGANPLVAKVKK